MKEANVVKLNLINDYENFLELNGLLRYSVKGKKSTIYTYSRIILKLMNSNDKSKYFKNDKSIKKLIKRYEKDGDKYTEDLKRKRKTFHALKRYQEFLEHNSNDNQLENVDEGQNYQMIASTLEKYYDVNNPSIKKRKNNISTVNGRKILRRDSKLAATALNEVNYKCEFDEKHITFETKKGKQYMEGHHLIPANISAAKIYENIDSLDNIFSLCPNCHREIHHGQKDNVQKIIEKLFEKRKDKLLLLFNNISLNDIYELYNY